MRFRGMWCAAFTIVIDGVLVDISELSENERRQILLDLSAGKTSGSIFTDGSPLSKKAS